MPVGGPHAEVRLKPQLRHRSCETKENELKPLLTIVQIADLHPVTGFINSAPVEHLNDQQVIP